MRLEKKHISAMETVDKYATHQRQLLSLKKEILPKLRKFATRNFSSDQPFVYMRILDIDVPLSNMVICVGGGHYKEKTYQPDVYYIDEFLYGAGNKGRDIVIRTLRKNKEAIKKANYTLIRRVFLSKEKTLEFIGLASTLTISNI